MLSDGAQLKKYVNNVHSTFQENGKNQEMIQAGRYKNILSSAIPEVTWNVMRPNRLLFIFMFLSLLKLFGCQNRHADKKEGYVTYSMNEFRQNIEVNRTLTYQMLDSSSDEKLEDKIITNIQSKLDPELSNNNDIMPGQSKERQAIYYIYEVESEVNNGGFDQFYFNEFVNNDHSYMFDRTIEAFKMVGAMKFANLIEKANQIFKANEKDFVGKEGLFEELDQEFFQTYDQENLYELRIRFIRNNILAFVDK
jgi:hypothetical protein